MSNRTFMSPCTPRLRPFATLLLAAFAAAGVGCTAPDDGEWDEEEIGEDAAEDGQEPSAGEQAMDCGCSEGSGGSSGGGSGSGGGGGGSSPPPEPPRLVVALRAASGHFVVAEGGGGGDVNANRTSIGDWERFKLIPLGGGNFALQTSNGKYVVAQNGGGGDVFANSSSISSASTFTMVNLPNGRTGFRTTVVPKYVVAEGGGGSVVNANRDVASTWESFTMIDQGSYPPAHSPYSTGTPLFDFNGALITKVCLESPTCCTSWWSSSCVTLAVIHTPG